MNQIRIADCHIHPAPSPGEDYSPFGNCGSPESQVEALRRAGIELACGSVLARGDSGRDFGKFSTIVELNNLSLHLRDRLKGFYLPGIHVHPAFPEESCRELGRCRSEGVLWIGELVGYLMGYDYDLPGMGAILAEAGRLKMPVNFHCGNLPLIENLCRQAPETSFVLAHPGECSDFRERIKLVAKYPNLHLDLSGTGLMRLGMLRHAVSVAGAEKILLGSDYPICNPAMYVHCVEYEDISPEDLRLVQSGNFLRLIGLLRFQ